MSRTLDQPGLTSQAGTHGGRWCGATMLVCLALGCLASAPASASQGFPIVNYFARGVSSGQDVQVWLRMVGYHHRGWGRYGAVSHNSVAFDGTVDVPLVGKRQISFTLNTTNGCHGTFNGRPPLQPPRCFLEGDAFVMYLITGDRKEARVQIKQVEQGRETELDIRYDGHTVNVHLKGI